MHFDTLLGIEDLRLACLSGHGFPLGIEVSPREGGMRTDGHIGFGEGARADPCVQDPNGVSTAVFGIPALQLGVCGCEVLARNPMNSQALLPPHKLPPHPQTLGSVQVCVHVGDTETLQGSEAVSDACATANEGACFTTDG